MVFGWGKKKEGTTEQTHQTKTVSISEIEHILKQRRQEKQESVLQQSKPHFEQIQKEMKEIARIVSLLKADDLKVDDIDKTLRVLVVRSKAEVIDTVSKESQKKIPQTLSYDDVLNAFDVSSHVLKKIGDVLGKNSRIIHVFAKKYAQELKIHLEQITSSNTAISKQIHDLSSFDLSAVTIKDMVEKITRLKNEIDEKNQHMSKLQELQNEYANTISTTEQKIATMRNSAEFVKLLEYRQQIKQVESQQDKLNKEIDDEFSKISRPLGKYVYVTSLEKPHKIILERLIANHSDTISAENKQSIITVLESCMKGIVSGTVSVKETDKSVAQITHLISLLDGFIAKKAGIKSQLQSLQEKLGIFDSKQLDDLEKQLARAKTDKEDSESKIKKLQEELGQDRTQRQTLMGDLQGALERISGTKYTIQF